MSFGVLAAVVLSVIAASGIVILVVTAPDPIAVVERTAKVVPAPLVPRTVRRRRVRKPDRLVDGWEEYVAQGSDRQGKVAFFKVLILPGDYRWDFGSEKLVTDVSGHVVDIAARLDGSGIAALMEKASQLICVGAASVEGSLAEEEQRAQLRADQLAAWVRPKVPSSMLMYTLNLGRHLGTCEGCSEQQTASQRRVVLIVVSAGQPGVEISAALSDALQKTEEFPLDLGAYSNFVLQSVGRGGAG